MKIEASDNAMVSALRNAAAYGESKIEREPDADKDDRTASAKAVKPASSVLPEGMGNNIDVMA